MTKESTGNFYTLFAVPSNGTTGVWRYKTQYLVGSTLSTESAAYFTVIEHTETIHKDLETSCMVYGTLTDVDGQALSSETVKFIGYSVTNDTYGGMVSVTTDSYGKFSLELEQSQTGYIVVDSLHYTKFVTIPSTASVLWSSL